MTCVVEGWRAHPYYGEVAKVRIAGGETVGDFSGWIRGAFREYVELPPGVYEVVVDGRREGCVVAPPEYPWHFAVPYMAVDWGDVVEIRIYAPEEPEVGRGRVVKLADLGPFSIYLGLVKGRRYTLRCCGKTRRFKSPPVANAPGVIAMYEVLPDRAADRLGCRDLRRGYCGGTLKDVAKLAITALDIADTLYLHPIYPAMSYHRYDVVDHLQVDEKLGGWSAFVTMRETLRRRGMKLVLDIVLYHVGLRNAIFPEGPFVFKNLGYTHLVKKIAEKMPMEALRELFRGEPPYETFLDVWLMPKLDYSKPSAVEYGRKVVEFWKSHVDGFRLDVAHGIPPGAWAEILKPAEGLYIFGEHMGNPAPFYWAVPGFTAYLLYKAAVDWLAKDLDRFVKWINLYIALTPPAALPYMNTFLENHDTDRAASIFDINTLYRGYALIFSLPGVPSIYAGGECGEVGRAEDHTNRRPYSPCPDSPLREFLKRLYTTRRELALYKGPAWVETRRSELVIHRGAVDVAVGINKLTVSNTERYIEHKFL